MNSIRIKEDWENTQTHALLSKHLIIDNAGDKFKIYNLKVILYKKGWGFHFQFQLHGIIHFLSITLDNLLHAFDKEYFEENAVYDLIVENSYYEKTPCLLITFVKIISDQKFSYYCRSASIGPLSSENYEISI